MQRVIFKNIDESIVIFKPMAVDLAKFGIEAVAAKDTPTGLPYWIVDTTDIPTDRTDRTAWEADEAALGPAHGVGSDSTEFEVV